VDCGGVPALGCAGLASSGGLRLFVVLVVNYVYCVITTTCESGEGWLTVIFGLLFGCVGCNKTLFLCLMKYVPKHVIKKKTIYLEKSKCLIT
jgi:hypothetical protein